jgi:hypothetical protein
MVQNNASGAVKGGWGKDGIEGRANGTEDIIGETGRPRQRDLSADIPEILGP